ncbi:MAG TPA: glutathione S-transferase family protein, partial [Allosphingosinicella sp.]
IDSGAICEYFEETIEKSPMIPGTAVNRAEVRRLVALLDDKLYGEVVGPLLDERMRKRLVNRDPPDTKVLREAMKVANAHLDYLDYLLDHRRWLAGPVLSLADLTAAAHLSVADYLGGIDWRGHKQTADWYSVMKSRPSFRPLLAERMEVISPPQHYDKVDF